MIRIVIRFILALFSLPFIIILGIPVIKFFEYVNDEVGVHDEIIKEDLSRRVGWLTFGLIGSK